jgi:hypothetical protein
MAGPAWAADFTSTAWLNWTALTFIRVSVTVAPSQTAQMALVSGLGPGRDDAADGFWVSTGWPDQMLTTNHFPQLGTATSITGPTLLSASTSLVTTGMVAQFGGITVGPASIGRHCYLSQGVTIGASGQGDKHGCPTIGDYVYLAPGAKVFGKITAGHYVKIGANAVIYADIPNMAEVAMKPGFEILSINGNQP